MGSFRIPEDSNVTAPLVTVVPRPLRSPQLLCSSCRSLLPGKGHALFCSLAVMMDW